MINQTFLYCKPDYQLQKFFDGEKVEIKDFWKMFAVKQVHDGFIEIYLFSNNGQLMKYITLNDKTLWKPIHVEDLLKLANFFPAYKLKQGIRTQYKNKYEVLVQLYKWYEEL